MWWADTECEESYKSSMGGKNMAACEIGLLNLNMNTDTYKSIMSNELRLQTLDGYFVSFSKNHIGSPDQKNWTVPNDRSGIFYTKQYAIA